MFLRMLVRAAILRRGRAASALLAMVVAAAAATAMLNLYVDIESKLLHEFRSYGANVVIVAKDGHALPPGTLASVQSSLDGRALAAPFAYAVARTATAQPVVVAGTDFEQVKKLNTWWSVNAWPSASGQALLGAKTASSIAASGNPFDLTFQGHTIHLAAAGILHTGAAEDSRIYLSLADFESWTGLKPSTLEVAVSGNAGQISAAVRNLQQKLPAADVRPVRRMVEGEARVLGKTRSMLLWSSVLIIVTAALCVLATLIGWVFDRRRDFAIMKALGASERLISAFFAAEAAALGGIGGLLGFVIGVGLAAWIGRINFHAPVTPRLDVLPAVLLGAVAVALLSAIVPISLLRRVEPATILRGE
jgi:putative ABC transport system permease protein